MRVAYSLERSCSRLAGRCQRFDGASQRHDGIELMAEAYEKRRYYEVCIEITMISRMPLLNARPVSAHSFTSFSRADSLRLRIAHFGMPTYGIAAARHAITSC